MITQAQADRIEGLLLEIKAHFNIGKTGPQIRKDSETLKERAERSAREFREKQARKAPGNSPTKKTKSSSVVVSKGCGRGDPSRSQGEVAGAFNKTGR